MAPSFPRAGFTLVEMAVVMVVMGLVMLTVFPALNAVRSANQMSLTQSNLRSLMLATAAYVQANGCLPCPANAGGGGATFGRLGYAATSVACGVCSAPEGIVPFASMGIPASTARDGWGHWITMRVDPALTTILSSASSVFVPPQAPCISTDVTNGFCAAAQVGFADKGLCKTGLATTNRISVTTPGGASQQAAVIFVSHGSTGYGSYYAQTVPGPNNGYALPFPSNYGSCASGSYAVCNGAQTGTTQFYDAQAVISATNPYDDVLAYADRNTLVSMLGNPSCNTVW